jgi:hypothetical protein
MLERSQSSSLVASVAITPKSLPDFRSLANEDVICSVLRNRSARCDVNSRLSIKRSDSPKARPTTSAIGSQSAVSVRPQSTNTSSSPKDDAKGTPIMPQPAGCSKG